LNVRIVFFFLSKAIIVREKLKLALLQLLIDRHTIHSASILWYTPAKKVARYLEALDDASIYSFLG